MNEKRTGLFENGLIWFGAGVSIAEILTGTYLAPLGMGKGLAAILIGHIIGCLMLFLAGVIGGSTSIDVAAALSSMQAGLDAMEIPELLLLVMETSLVSLCMKIMSVLITVILYGRMIEIYLYTSLAPIPFATMSNREWGHVGTNYFRGLFALAFQAFLMMVCVAIYAALISSVRISSNMHSALIGVAAYTVILCFSLMKTGSLSKQIFGSH